MCVHIVNIMENVDHLRLSIFMAHCWVSCGYSWKFIEQDKINVNLFPVDKNNLLVIYITSKQIKVFAIGHLMVLEYNRLL